MDEARADDVVFYTFWHRLAAFVSWIALTLALAGIYAVMAFTVSRRTREIGIRVALGSDPRRVALAIFRRPLIQVGLGVLVGIGWTGFLAQGVSAGYPAVTPALATLKGASLVSASAALMLGVCLLACGRAYAPCAVRRAETEALRADI